MTDLIGLLVREAGKSTSNAVGEVREAIDFLRYYAAQGRTALGSAHRPIGPVAAISPWNFPLAIFTGQVAAALMAGNPVLAKPAEETLLIAAQAVAVLHAAGIPPDALLFLPGDGRVGPALVAAPDVAGVLFTGSTEVARLIQRRLAERLSVDGTPVPLIAETGGQNAMIVDSSALTEQVVADVIASAFDSAGQRCSALRLLCLLEDVADRTLTMLKGACAELSVRPTDHLSADIGPVISEAARDLIEAHVARLAAGGAPVHRLPLDEATAHGLFIAPAIIEIASVADLHAEIFGPVLHVVRYRRNDLPALLEAINALGYGLTFGLHTRLDATIETVTKQIDVGNIYVNRNMVGAVAGVQPFGGHGLSGTGPKAGGPLYLGRLVIGPSLSLPGTSTPNAALADLMVWLEARGETRAVNIAHAFQENSLVGRSIDLPGPVGEENRYEVQPRGLILLCPSSSAGLYEQLAAILATGNDIAIEPVGGFHDLPTDWPLSVARRIRPATLLPLDGALIEGSAEVMTARLRTLADVDGPLTLTQTVTSSCREESSYRLDWLVRERTISTNVTASRGNAPLMGLASTAGVKPTRH